MDIVLKPKQITKFFTFIVIFLTLAHIIGQWTAFYLELKGGHKPIVDWFNLDVEHNFPSYYSSIALLFCFSLLAVIVFLLVYMKFILNLPSKIRILFIVAGIVYILGAIGVELIGGRYYELYGDDNITYTIIIITIEELLEMAGIVVFIYALSSYIDTELKGLRLGIKS